MPQPHGPEEIEHLREGSLVRYRVGRGIHVERKILQGGSKEEEGGREGERGSIDGMCLRNDYQVGLYLKD